MSGIAHIAAINEAVKGEDGRPLKNDIGQWAFSIEMLRRKSDDLRAAATEQTRELADKTGMPAMMGRYAQRPRLHFQAYMFDILIDSDAATLAVEMADGSRRALGSPVRFRSLPENAPAFYTSFDSYRIHAAMLPTVDDMRLLLDPKAAFVTASFAMRMENGRVDTVTLRTPLAGVAEAWQAMNAANLEAHREIAGGDQALDRIGS